MSISPNVPSPQESYHYENSGTPRWIAVLFGVLFVALAAMVHVVDAVELTGDAHEHAIRSRID